MKALALSCWLIGCAAATNVPAVETTGATYVPIGAAAGAIGQTECARAQACGAIPSRGVYRDADFCDTDLRTKIDDDLMSGDCKWVDRGRLDLCLSAVRSESCATMNVAERTPPPCRRAWLCR